MSYNLPYYDNVTNSNYGTHNHRKKVLRLAKRFEESQEDIALAVKLEMEDQKAAFIAYQEIRAKRQPCGNRDVLLYYNDDKVM